MSTNKHAAIRYQALDKCFSNFNRRFYINDLIDECNKAIYQLKGIENGVKRRQIYDDIKFMESEEGYAIPLDKIRDGKRNYYRYSDKNFSINHQPLNQMEAEQLKNTILMLNRFKGLPQFDWMGEVLTKFEHAFKLNTTVETVVSFEQNQYLKGLEYFTDLFNAIVNKQVLKIKYKPAFCSNKEYILHPYHLKQYNNRWFLFGLSISAEQNLIMNMAIDRIEEYTIINQPYIDNTEIDFNEYFDDVIGVTVPKNEQIETIRLKVDKQRYNYIESKPIHPSQKEITKEKTADSVVIELKIIPNYEFETLLLGFADSIEILKPQSLREKITLRAKKIIEKNIRSADGMHERE